VDKERNIGAPRKHRNRHGNSIPVPDRNYAKYDQRGRGRKGQGDKYKFEDDPLLTIDRNGGIESKDDKHYSKQGAHAGQRINPYCPPVWTIPSDDAPFIIESGEELPAIRGKPMEMRLRDTPQWGRDRDREAHMKIPTRTCQSFTAAKKSILIIAGLWKSTIVTIEATETGVRRRGERIRVKALPVYTY
jgi:hypothetical protein